MLMFLAIDTNESSNIELEDSVNIYTYLRTLNFVHSNAYYRRVFVSITRTNIVILRELELLCWQPEFAWKQIQS